MLFSVIVPCYNEEEMIDEFYQETKKVVDEIKRTYSLDAEYIFVDDGSKDKTLEKLRVLHQENDECKYISFSRNFGKEAALYAGLQTAKGDYVVVIDADLQDPPALMLDMMKIMHDKKVNCVAAKRKNRKGEPAIRRFFSKQFYKIINSMSETKIDDGVRDYRLMSRKMVDGILEISEVNRFSKGIFSWVGYSTEWVEYEYVDRKNGKSKWSFRKLWRYAIDGIVGYTTNPLKVASNLGIWMFILSFIGIIFVVIRKLIYGDSTSGWPSLVCIILFVSGVQLLCIGIIGEYLAKTYVEVKKRPIYLIEETDEEDDSREEREN